MPACIRTSGHVLAQTRKLQQGLQPESVSRQLQKRFAAASRSDVRVHLQPEQLEFVDVDMGALGRERREASYMSFMRLDAILISTERHFFRRAGLDDAAEHLKGCFPSDMLRLV